MRLVTTRYQGVHGEFALQFFAGDDAFVQHAVEHFCEPREPWDRSLNRSFLQKACRKISSNDVSVMEALYSKTVAVLDTGIRFSLSEPVYAYLTERTTLADKRCIQTNSIYFLAHAGFIVIARDGVVRTAYFPGESSTISNFTLFKNGWKSIVARCSKRRHVDAKSNTASERLAVEWVDHDHWRICTNPYPEPKGERLRRTVHSRRFYSELDSVRHS